MSDYSPLPEEMRSAKPATAATIKANSAVLDALDFSNRQSFEDASKGFIASLPEVIIPHDNGGRNAYDLEALSFLDDEAPDTVNPSLWKSKGRAFRRFTTPEIPPSTSDAWAVLLTAILVNSSEGNTSKSTERPELAVDKGTPFRSTRTKSEPRPRI